MYSERFDLIRDEKSSALLSIDTNALEKRRLNQKKQNEFRDLQNLVFSLIQRIEKLENGKTD